VRLSLRLGLILSIAAILLSTLAISAGLTYWHAVHKVDVEMQSTLAAVQRTIRVALQDIQGSPSEPSQVKRLVRTFDESRHARVELKDRRRTLQSSTPAPVQTGMPDWFFALLAPREQSGRVDWPHGLELGQYIQVTADPRNEAGEVWSDIRLHLTTILLFCLLTLGRSCPCCSAMRWRRSPAFLQAFERTGRGEVGDQLPVSGPLELQSLATGFNRMSALLAESQDKNRKLDAQLEAVQEEERASLARDLHDDVGPLLFSIDVDATTIRALAEKKTNPNSPSAPSRSKRPSRRSRNRSAPFSGSCAPASSSTSASPTRWKTCWRP
jgi:two-component system, NarL family, sensor histidine kinase UhpB